MNNRLITIFVALLSLVGIVLFVRVMGIDEGSVEEMSGAVSPLVTFSIFLIGLTVVVSVVASLWSLFKNANALKKSLLGLAVLGVLFAISYMLADSTPVIDANNQVIDTTESTIRLSSTGILYSIFLVVIAGAFFVFDLLKGLIKS